jgi:hypothetical protein
MIHERARDDRETDVRARAPTYFRGEHAVCNSRALPENGTGERNVSWLLYAECTCYLLPFGSRCCCCCCCSIERSRVVRPSSKVRLELCIPQVFRRSASSACLLAATAYKSHARAEGHTLHRFRRRALIRARSQAAVHLRSTPRPPGIAPVLWSGSLGISSNPPRLTPSRLREREREREIASDRLNSQTPATTWQTPLATSSFICLPPPRPAPPADRRPISAPSLSLSLSLSLSPSCAITLLRRY